MQPLVSVIISCYNHKDFVEQALLSVLNQTYKNTEVVLIDDSSTDGSIEVVKSLKEKYPQIKLICNKFNLGLCKSFNRAFKQSAGSYIIDLAADDYLLPHKITTQLDKFDSLSNDYGVVYSDLIFIDEHGNELSGVNNNTFPEGDVFAKVLARHCVYASTMLVKREVYEELQGYDESLAYEDFDFFIRAARNWKFAVVKTPLMVKRELSNSLGNQFFKGNSMGKSTLKVCQKAKTMVKNKEERNALKHRLYYEAYDSFRHGKVLLALRFLTV